MGIRRPDSIIRTARGAVAVATCVLLANCASSGKFASKVDPKYGVSSSPRVVAWGDPVPKGGGTYRIGKPYTVAGRVYVPEEDTGYRAEGMARFVLTHPNPLAPSAQRAATLAVDPADHVARQITAGAHERGAARSAESRKEN